MPTPVRQTAWAVLLLALASQLTGCAARTQAARLYPEIARQSGRQIRKVQFTGNEPFSKDSLLSLIQTQPSRCSLLGLPICVPFTRLGRQIHRVSVQRVAQDVVRLTAFYRYSGYFGTTVEPDVKANADKADVTFNITRGDSIVLDSLSLSGADSLLNQDSMVQRLPLKAGEIFHLGRLAASADQVLRAMQRQGHPYAEVLRNYSVDTVANRARASLSAVPGPHVIIDSIVLNGAHHLGRRPALRQLTFRKGQVLRLDKLVESQRNLYSLDIVQLASVSIAPDSLDATPQDSTRATILVNIAESKKQQVDAAIAYGTVECLRTETQYINRSFTGGGRRLAATASVSKIGLGGVTATGVGESLCRAFATDTFQNTLDYRFAVDFTQPYFLTPLNHLSAHFFVERQSEPSVYQREAQGTRLLITRRLAPRTLLSGGFDVEHGRTLASPALFCQAFEVCEPETIEQLNRPRWRNSLGLNLVRDKTDYPLDPTSGTVVRTGFAWAPPWLLSDLTFLRWTGEASMYREVRPGWIAAGSVRLGNFFKTAVLSPTGDFLPPEERFYAGGANSVRGYTRNALGDGVWVASDTTIDKETGAVVPEGTPRFVPLGGTSMSVVNAELRLPSPFMPRRLRLAAFIDGGAIGTGNLWSMETGEWRFTPGVGVRINSPVGPARVDVAYNMYGDDTGPLYLAQGRGTLLRLQEKYRPDPGNFFNRFRIHLAVGQAF